MQRFILLLLISFIGVLFSFTSYAQTLRFFDVDQSKFQTMSAKFYAFDDKNNRVSPAASEMSVHEDGKTLEVVSVTCPTEQEPKALSSVIMVDISGSMATTYSGVTGLDLAVTAATSWINGLPQGLHEAAIGTFNSSNYFNRDFTTDKPKLLSALSTLQPDGGTDYDMGLLKPFAGALQISNHAKYQKVIIYITDGLPNFEPNSQAIIAEAQKQGCIIFAITLGLPCPKSLKNITAQTGGQYFENVTTQQEAEKLYLQMLQTSQSAGPCEIIWKSKPACSAEHRKAVLEWKKIAEHVDYDISQPSYLQMSIAPTTLSFKSPRQIGQSNDTTITVKASSTEVTILNITSSDASFDIFPKKFSLLPNESKTLTVRFTPKDSAYYWTQFTFVTESCSQIYFASGRFSNKKPSPQTSKLVVSYPNSGEFLAAGSDDTIRWNGIPATDTVTLEISNDNGKSWNLITDKATGLEYKYRFPTIVGNQYRVRVSQNSGDSPNAINYLDFLGHKNAVRMVDWSPDGSRIATASDDSTAVVWDAETGDKLFTLRWSNSGAFTHIKWNKDSMYIATGDQNGYAIVWDCNTGERKNLNRFSITPTTSLCWNVNGSNLISSYMGGGGWTLRIGAGSAEGIGGSDRPGTHVNYAEQRPNTNYITFCVEDSNSVMVYGGQFKNYYLKGHTKLVRHFGWNPSGTKIATAGDDLLIKIWDTTGATLRTYSGHTKIIREVVWSPDGSRLASISDDLTCCIWNPNIVANRLFELKGHTGIFTHVAWSPDGKKIATSNADGTVRIWNPYTGQQLKILEGHTGEVTYVAWNFDGSKIATSSKDNTAKIWDVSDTASNIAPPIQTDVSDTMFTLGAPTPVAQDVDMGRVSIGNTKDTVIYDYMRNTGNFPYRIDSVVLVTGANSSEFIVVPQQYPIIVPVGATQLGEFVFTPTTPGLKSAQIKIYTQTEVLVKTIVGNAVADTVQVFGTTAMFGQVDVGSEKDLPQEYTLYNRGTTPVTISIASVGPNLQDYEIKGGKYTYILKPKESVSIDVRFAPKEIGRSSGGMMFDFGGKRPPLRVQMFGEGISNSPLTPLLYSVNMGSAIIGKTKDSIAVLMVKNRLTVPVTIPRIEIAGQNPESFSILDNKSLTIEPDQTVPVNIRFTPLSKGYKYAEAVFHTDSSAAPLSVTLWGRGIDEAGNNPLVGNATISVGSVAAKPGDTVVIPLIMTRSKNLKASKAAGIVGSLVYNGALLEPIGNTPAATISNGEATVPFNFPILYTIDTQVRYLFRAKTSTNATTPLVGKDVTSVRDSIVIEVVNGEFNLLPGNGIDTTRNGNSHSDFNQIQLGPIAPNPVQNYADVTLRLIEKGISTLSLIDARGRVVTTYFQKEIGIGVCSVHLDFSAIGIGTYFLLLQTPTQEKTLQIEVKR